jgi:hypothetical protein
MSAWQRNKRRRKGSDDWVEQDDVFFEQDDERVGSADELMDTPEVNAVIIRTMRIKRLLEFSAQPIIVKKERRFLRDEEVAAGRRVVS